MNDKNSTKIINTMQLQRERNEYERYDGEMQRRKKNKTNSSEQTICE